MLRKMFEADLAGVIASRCTFVSRAFVTVYQRLSTLATESGIVISVITSIEYSTSGLKLDESSPDPL